MSNRTIASLLAAAMLWPCASFAQRPLPPGTQAAPIEPKSILEAQQLLEQSMPGAVDTQSKEKARVVLQRQAKALSAGRPPASPFNIHRMGLAIDAGHYPQVVDFIRQHVGEPAVLEAVRRRALAGNVPMMWELADLYAIADNETEASKWAHAALFGTLQERSLCLDHGVDLAAPKLTALHPLSVNMARTHQHLVKASKIFAINLLASPLPYPSPEPWLCLPYARNANFLNQGSSPARGGPPPRIVKVTYDPIYFPLLRARARNQLRAKLEIASPLEVVPPMPQPPAGVR